MKKALVFRADTHRDRLVNLFPGWEAIIDGEALSPDVKYDVILYTFEPTTNAITRGWAYAKKLELCHLTPTGRVEFFD